MAAAEEIATAETATVDSDGIVVRSALSVTDMVTLHVIVRRIKTYATVVTELVISPRTASSR